MNDLVKNLNNIRSLRNLAKELDLAQLESIKEKLQLIINEKREDIIQQERQAEERKARIEKYKTLLKQDGITTEELAEILGEKLSTTKKRESRPAKYQYIDEKGQLRTWTGQGRTPKVIQLALDANKSLESFAI